MEHRDINIVLADVSDNAINNLIGGFLVETNNEQIGIRTTLANKMRFESVEGATSSEKLNNLLEAYVSLKNAVGGDIIDQSKELLDMLKVNLASLEKTANQDKENMEEKLKSENEQLKNELELIRGKYHQLNKEYSNLILKIELKGIKL